MPASCTVSGRFARKGVPVAGVVRFTPQRLWVIEDGVPWACLAPEAMLDEGGGFTVRVTATDSDAVPWHYRVETPAGEWKISVGRYRSAYSLRELIDVHHPG